MPKDFNSKSEKYWNDKRYKIVGTKKCYNCGMDMSIFVKRDLKRKKFCSRQCLAEKIKPAENIWNKPEIVERMKKNMRKPHKITELLLKTAKERGLKRLGKKTKGKYIICQQCGKNFWAFQSRINGETAKNGQLQLRKFCSVKCRSLSSRKPDELKADKTRLKEWRLKVFKKDNYTCQVCGCKRKRLLMAHHEREKGKYPDLTYDVNNGKTLCIYCHIKKHPRLEKFILSALKIKLNKSYEQTI